MWRSPAFSLCELHADKQAFVHEVVLQIFGLVCRMCYTLRGGAPC